MGTYSVKIFISLFPVFVLFAFYFRTYLIFHRDVIWEMRSFFYGMLFSLAAAALMNLAQMTLQNYPINRNILFKAFVHASLLEEGLRFIFIYFSVRNSRETFTVTEGMFNAILFGLGFSFSENLLYSATYDGFVILLRCVSSVPVHVFASGIMGYFISYRHHCAKDQRGFRRLTWFKKRRLALAASAFLIPFLYHGIYDYLIFSGGDWNYLLPAILILGFVRLEYHLARGRQIMGKLVLNVIGADADDMEIIQIQEKNEKWMRDVQEKEEKPPALFINKWTPFNTAAGASLLLFACAMLFVYLFHYRIAYKLNKASMFLFDPNIPPQTLLSLIVLLPFSIGLILIFLEKINYLFFREQMLRLPIAALVSIGREGRKHDTIVLDVPSRGIFLAGVKDLNVGDRLQAEFITDGGRRVIPVFGLIRWVNRDNPQLPQGAVFRYLSPKRGFGWFRASYKFMLMRQRLANRFFSK